MKHLKSINEYWYSEEDERYYSDDEQPSKEEEPSIDDQIYSEIEMRIRADEDFMPYGDIMDIANTYGVDEEYVAQMVASYIADRQSKGEEELKDAIKEIIKDDFDGEIPTFAEFYNKYEELNYADDMIVDFSKDDIKKMFISLTTNPNQLSLDLEVGESLYPTDWSYNDDTEPKYFLKSNSTKKFTFFGLNIRNESVLKEVGNLKVGESINYPLGSNPKDKNFKFSIKRIV